MLKSYNLLVYGIYILCAVALCIGTEHFYNEDVYDSLSCLCRMLLQEEVNRSSMEAVSSYTEKFVKLLSQEKGNTVQL